jgi:hypothetical protein
MTKSRFLTLVLVVTLLPLGFAGCSGQQTGTSQVAEQTEPAPPPAPATGGSDVVTPPPPPPQSATRTEAVPEERPRRIEPKTPPAPTTVTLTIPSGTALGLQLAAPLTSETALVGDKVTATLQQPLLVGERVVFPAGSTVEGTVTDVKPAKKGFKDTGGALALNFNRIVSPNGRAATIAAGLSRIAEGSAGKKAGIIGGSAAGGALLGKLLDKNAAGAAAVGAAVGTAVAGSTKGKEAKIGTEEMLSVALEQAAKVTVPR